MAGRRPQFVWMMVARSGTLIMGMLASVVVARALPPQSRGTYYMAVSVATAALSLGHLSVEQAQTALWARRGHRSRLDRGAVPLGLCVGSVAGAGALGLSALFQGRGHLPDTALLVTACAGVPLGMAVLYGTNITLLRDRTRVAGWAMVVSAVVQCLCLIGLGLTGLLTVWTVVAVWSGSFAVSLAVLVGAGGVTTGRPDVRLAAATCAKGLRFHTGSAAAYLLVRSDVFLLNALAGPRDVGVYTLAVTLAELSRLAVDVFAQVTLSLQFDGEGSASAQVTARLVRFTVLLGVTSAVTTVAVASVAVTPLYGHAYASAAGLVALLVPGVLLLSTARPLSTFLLRQGSSRLVVVPSLTALAVNTALNVAMIPVWGAAGCAVASTVAYGTLVAFQVRYFTRTSGLRWTCLLPTGAERSRLATEVRHRTRALRAGGTS
ncbi:lipopolysaccharide biosynthesis protein [Streptomyces sp. NPDC048664]|uniref:lipopolysaccharide biosynthesis protein n=1 Tax=Streptomyces sp. NPDC048664 TaxID=3154505 RepID=UPI00342F6001